MTKSARILIIGAVFALGAAAGLCADRCWRSLSSEPAAKSATTGEPAGQADDGEGPEPAAVVRTVTATSGELPRSIDGIGMAVIPASAVSVEAWPGDVLVKHVLVQQGELVEIGAPIAEVVATRDSETQLGAAEVAFANASRGLEAVQQRLDRGLATRTDLVTAQSTHDEARQRLDRLRTGQPPAEGVLRAHAAGVVTNVRVQPGSTVPGGTALMDIAGDTVVAQIGLDPADAGNVRVGQVFEVQSIDERISLNCKGTVTLLSHAINTASRQFDVTLSLAGTPLPRPGTALRARTSLPAVAGLLVPREALVPDGDEMVLFVIKEGTAVRNSVTILSAGREQVAIGAGCSAGDHVVVSGQGQLTAGATVREIPAGTSSRPNRGDNIADR